MAVTYSPSISNVPPEHPALDFTFLRGEGIRYIQELAGSTWTDYNTHDPGVTILDQLCYALTDLSYRIDYNIKDLLANRDGAAYESLFSPAEILTVNPVTIPDIRKIAIDVEGVKNAWVEKIAQPKPDIYYDAQNSTLNLADGEGTSDQLYITGLYRVLIEKNEAVLNPAMESDIRARLHSCRSLCEDFSEIRILNFQDITLYGSIDVERVEDVNRLVANVLFRIASFISPQIRFYTLEELVSKGKMIDEIFDGPALFHGFIDDDELLAYDRRTELHTSDIIRELMDEPGVLGVNNIALAAGSEPPQTWSLALDPEKTPRLAIGAHETLESLKFFRNGLEISLDYARVIKFFTELTNARLYRPLDIVSRDIIPEAGSYRNISTYYSIQHHFPQAYGIGETGLPESASPQRKAQAKQLKAYLMFFEQILADYFSQVDHVKDLFSFYDDSPVTYFHQSLAEAVPGAGEIFQNPGQDNPPLSPDGYEERLEQSLERKNRFLNHLMARFGESLTDYALAMHSLTDKDADEQLQLMQRLVSDKSAFLRAYPGISNDRGRAFDYTLESWDTGNVSGLEKRIAAKLGIADFKRKSLADADEEGFHMIEHILLRPVSEDVDGLSAYLVPRNIDSFEKSDRDGWVRCYSVAHGLQNGESVEIKDTPSYSGSFAVDRVLSDSFEIQAAYTGAGIGTIKPNWIRKELDTRFLSLTQYPIDDFSASGHTGNTLCTASGHGLEEDEVIKITGTTHYDGTYHVRYITEPSFEIEKDFQGKESSGRWISENQQRDPYSLQLTFVFPGWLPRFGEENTDFRAFVENTIREQTPVHITVFIQWLGKEEMSVFDKAYRSFLDQLRTA